MKSSALAVLGASPHPCPDASQATHTLFHGSCSSYTHWRTWYWAYEGPDSLGIPNSVAHIDWCKEKIGRTWVKDYLVSLAVWFFGGFRGRYSPYHLQISIMRSNVLNLVFRALFEGVPLFFFAACSWTSCTGFPEPGLSPNLAPSCYLYAGA